MRNKKLVAAFGLLLLIAIVAPVMAAPPGAQKVPITLKFIPVPSSAVTLERDVTPSGVTHSLLVGVYNLQLRIDGGPIITGVCTRTTNGTFNPYALVGIHQEEYVMTFTSMPGGTFEGEAGLKFYFTDSTRANWDMKTHGVFHGTGAFEGQMIIAGYDGPKGGTWSGYLLKP